MSKPLGLVNRILPFSAVDGPGNRFVIFLQGCNFNCISCHNPQTIGLCDACGVCVAECPGEALQFAESGTAIKWDQSRCLRCDTCIKVCPADSNPHSQWLEVELVLEKFAAQPLFYPELLFLEEKPRNSRNSSLNFSTASKMILP